MKTGEDYLILMLGITGATFIINRILWREEQFELAQFVETLGTAGVGVTVIKVIWDTCQAAINI
ncbi:MAG: hypothetical protein JM58_09350 [Peptococcaceae bacterium BICA1-8]|nr:MAG: hypothetical protein JM58_09350 [Peptococcaceae bacterium BICA1-8]